MRGGFVSDIAGNCRTPVTALDPISRIALPIHQNDEGFCHASRAPASSRCWSRESETRKRWYYNVEGRHTTVGWPCERLDQSQKFKEGTGPSVKQ